MASDTLAMRVYEKSRSKHRDQSSGKVVRELTSGDDLHRKTGKWNLMYRLIDRANNWYEETFRDRDTGEIVHKSAEPLTHHRRAPKSK
jgi:hypothetical protein